MPDSRSTNRSHQWEEAYPEALRKREHILAKCRNRGKSDRVSEGAAQIGVALSGGGIRSATFAFGVIQALAKRKALQDVDVLSTVSGGGYIGALISRLYSRRDVMGPDDVARAILPPHYEGGKVRQDDRVQSEGGNDGRIKQGVVWKWLKANGRHLAPARGSGDVLLAAAVVVRNWLTVHVVLGTLTLALFLFLHSIRLFALTANTESPTWIGETLSFLLTVWNSWLTWCDSLAVGERFPRWSPWSILPVLVAAYAVVVGSATWVFGGDIFSRRFQCFSKMLKKALLPFGIALAVAVIDTFGRTIFDLICRHPCVWVDAWPVISLGVAGSTVAIVAMIRGLAIYLSNRFGTGWASLSLRLQATFTAGLLFTLELTSINILSHNVAWTLDHATTPMWATVAALLFICILVGNCRAFLNRSSLWPLYTARLIRAYLGASNPKRVDLTGENGVQKSVTRLVDGDDTSANWRREALCGIRHGAPLHLVNVTINETLDGASGIQHNDRNGIGMAISPVGISAGIRHHLVFKGPCGCHAKVFPEVPGDPTGGQTGTGAVYRMFEYELEENSGTSDKPIDRLVRYRGERLTLGQWTGISGAAFSTGMGSRTSLAASLLLGFFNVRLGYWWNSGIKTKSRKGVTAKRSSVGRFFSSLLPVQSQLLDEFTARFRGTLPQWWYLSDGGHFENTGGYELIRRRLPLIVIIDAEADPDYRFEGLGNLVRKARADFGAEIEFDNIGQTVGAFAFRELAERHLGSLNMLRPRPVGRPAVPREGDSRETRRNVTGSHGGPQRSTAHAALARVRYLDGATTDSLLVYVKPTILGDEPVDILHYHAANPVFPQQTTADQFFDEAQWESYRQLGFLVADRVFRDGFQPYLRLRNNHLA